MARPHSELESFVLGLVWQFGPSSPYDVRRELLDSPSSQWSGSAGAIYPLMVRLERRGLLASKSEHHGNRPRRMYRTTPKGLTALRAWVGPPLSPEAISVSYDPLRSRARFLAALTPAQRREWLDAAQAALTEVESKVRTWQDLYGQKNDPFLNLLTRHGELDIAMRRAWLQEARRTLGA